MKFIVLATYGLEERAVGPYRSFKSAEGDAKAWDGVGGWSCCVLPIVTPSTFMEERLEAQEG